MVCLPLPGKAKGFPKKALNVPAELGRQAGAEGNLIFSRPGHDPVGHLLCRLGHGVFFLHFYGFTLYFQGDPGKHILEVYLFYPLILGKELEKCLLVVCQADIAVVVGGVFGLEVPDGLADDIAGGEGQGNAQNTQRHRQSDGNAPHQANPHILNRPLPHGHLGGAFLFQGTRLPGKGRIFAAIYLPIGDGENLVGVLGTFGVVGDDQHQSVPG